MKKVLCEGSFQEALHVGKRKLAGLCPVCWQPIRLTQGTNKLEAHDEV